MLQIVTITAVIMSLESGMFSARQWQRSDKCRQEGMKLKYFMDNGYIFPQLYVFFSLFAVFF